MDSRPQGSELPRGKEASGFPASPAGRLIFPGGKSQSQAPRGKPHPLWTATPVDNNKRGPTGEANKNTGALRLRATG